VRFPVGQNTVNYRARAGGRDVLVKNYPVGSEVAGEVAAISLTQLAGQHGVPIARVVRSRSGEVVHRFGVGHAISVWEWVEARAVEGLLTRAQQVAAGRALGGTHRSFLAHRASRRHCEKAMRWLTPDIARIENRIDTMLQAIAGRDTTDDFDGLAAGTLIERRGVLARVPELLAGAAGVELPGAAR